MTNLRTDMKTFLAADAHGKHMTVAEYLDRLAASIWDGHGSTKFGWDGESDWRSPLYQAAAAMFGYTWDPNWGLSMQDEKKADAFITATLLNRHTVENP